jgi:hypothetical protein
VDQTHLAGGANAGPREARRVDGPVFSTGCIVVASAIVFLVLFVIPALIWAAGICFGQ